MNAERQAVALAGGVDRPEMPPPERHLLHRQHQHLHEALVGGAALDLGDGRGRVVADGKNHGELHDFKMGPGAGSLPRPTGYLARKIAKNTTPSARAAKMIALLRI